MFDTLSASNEPEFKIAAHPSGVKGLAFTPDGQRLLSMASDGRVKVWDVNSGELLKEFGNDPETEEAKGEHDAMALASDGSLVAVGRDGSVDLWDVETGERQSTFPDHDSKIVTLGFSRTISASWPSVTCDTSIWPLDYSGLSSTAGANLHGRGTRRGTKHPATSFRTLCRMGTLARL